MKWTNVICISNIQTAKSCPIEARVVPKEMLIVKDTAALKNGDEVVTSVLPRLSKLKSPRMYLEVLSLLLLLLYKF